MLSRELLAALAMKGRIEIIRALRSFPDRHFTVNELARVSRVPAMTTWRSVKDLRRLGVVKTRKVGNATSIVMTDDKEILKTLRIIPDTDPQRTAARLYATMLGQQSWMQEARLFGSVGRGEHAPGEEVDIAVVYDDKLVSEETAKKTASEVAQAVKEETNVTVMPLCVALKDMGRRGGLAAELRDKETIWRR